MENRITDKVLFLSITFLLLTALSLIDIAPKCLTVDELLFENQNLYNSNTLLYAQLHNLSITSSSLNNSNIFHYNNLQQMSSSSEDCYGETIILCPNCSLHLACTGSMRPTFNCKSTLHLKKCWSYSVGDIVLINIPYKNYNYTLHRIWIINSTGIYTKGDALKCMDTRPIQIDNILAKVIRIFY